jgi:putative nucleotidyltransferase with HDIG domain
MPRKKIEVHALRHGMYVAELDRPWLDSPFAFQGFFIQSDRDLQRLRETCEYVFIDLDRSRESEPLVGSPPAAGSMRVQREARAEPNPAPPTVKENASELVPWEPEFQDAVVKAHACRAQATGFLDRALDSARAGERIQVEDVNSAVSSLIESIHVNVNATMWLNHLKRRDRHSADHCANVAVVALAFAHYLGYRDDELAAIGTGALLHDIGLMRLPDRLLNKPGELSIMERDEIREHPAAGIEMMHEAGELPLMALNIIRHHHERVNGSGYPDGLSGDAIPREALVVAIADVYDALITERPYRTSLSPHSSLTKIKQLSDTDFGSELTDAFMSCIGLYPISSVVELRNGVLAMVVGHTRKNRTRPEVMLLKDAKEQPYRDRPVINLDRRAEQRDGEQWMIRRVVDARQYGIDIEKFTIVYLDRLFQARQA